jgi:hypothetical protein
MRLYHQLHTGEQKRALEHCTEMIIQDIIFGDFELQELEDDQDGEKASVKKELEEAFKALAKIEDEDAKFDYVVNNEKLMSIAHEIAHTMVQQAYYMDLDDFCLFPDDYSSEEECIHCGEKHSQEEGEETAEDIIPKQLPPKKHSIN